MGQHIQAHAVVTQVRGEPQAFIGFNGIRTLILELIGPDLVEKANTTPLLTQVKQEPAALNGNTAKGFLKLIAAITAHAVEGIPGKTFGVGPRQYRLTVGNITQTQGNMLLTGTDFLKAMHIENAKGRGQATAFDKANDQGTDLSEIKGMQV
jgi:hypothetical protein